MNESIFSTGLDGVIEVFDARERGAMLYAEVESQQCFLGWK